MFIIIVCMISIRLLILPGFRTRERGIGGGGKQGEGAREFRSEVRAPVAHLISVFGVDSIAARVPENVILDETVVSLVHRDT